VTHHCTEDELTLYYYGEGRRRHDVERHLEACTDCAATYREIAGTLAITLPCHVAVWVLIDPLKGSS